MSKLETRLEWIPVAVAPHVKRLADAIGLHVEMIVKDAVDRAIAALSTPPPASTAPAPSRVDYTLEVALGPTLAAMLETTPSAAEDVFDAPPPEVTNAPADRPDHDPLPEVHRESRRGLHQDGQGASAGRLPLQDAAQDADSGRVESQRPAGLIVQARNSLDESKRILRERSKSRTAARSLATRAPLTAISPTPRHLKPTPAALDLARQRITARREREERETADRAAAPAARAPAADNPNAAERWTAAEIDDERSLAEAQKQPGELPRPSSSYEVIDGQAMELLPWMDGYRG